MRTYQPNVANPRTDKQVSHRDLFSQVTELASLLLGGFVKPLWDRNAKKMSGYNAFIQANMNSNAKKQKVTIDNFILSTGKIGVQVADFDIDETTATLTWSTDIKPVFSKPTDKLYAIIFDDTMEIYALTSGEVNREEGSWVFNHDGSLHGSAEHCVYCFLSEDGNMQSDSEALNA